jgi:hypothetical protein
MKLLNLITIKNLVFVSIFFLSTQSFSQDIFTTESIVIVSDDPNLISKSEAAVETNFNFVSWFMGTKQSVKESNSKESSTKKLLINSRVAPNRILMKTFLKKAQTQLSSIA